MQREIRRILEKSLPADCLEYLNQQFKEKEEMIQKVKDHERKVDWLLDEMAKKDAMIWQLFTGKLSEIQSLGSYPIESDYSTSQPFGYKRYNPFNPYFEAEMRRGTRNEMRRGVPGSEMRRASPSYEFEYKRGTRSEKETQPYINPNEEQEKSTDPFVNPEGEVY